MSSMIQMLPTEQHTSQKGEKFSLTLRKKHLTSGHDYWCYHVLAQHKAWQQMGFMVCAKKEVFEESAADGLAKTQALGEIKRLLEDASGEGRPLPVPLQFNGWSIL